MLSQTSNLKIIGWSEWISFPDLGIPRVKAKIDTGAKTSAIHAFDTRQYRRKGESWIDFSIHPLQRNDRVVVAAEAPILAWRHIKSSNGSTEKRPVILVNIGLMGEYWPIEMTLTNRDDMGFRMLLGREALKGRFLVNSSKTYLAGKPPKISSR